jgi:hypothetical protein
MRMRSETMALVQGWADTRAALRAWSRSPGRALGPWALGSLAIAVALLLAVWVVSLLSPHDVTPTDFPGIGGPSTWDDFRYVMTRNALVLALHALACVAGFMAGSSLPQVAEGYSGIWRWIHEKAGPLAIGFVVLATSFSLITQAYVLGGAASSLAWQLDIPKWQLIVGILPHALPELFALFLPLAAWTIASRRGLWHELLAATFATTAIAAPLLALSGIIEVWVTPRVLLGLSG